MGVGVFRGDDCGGDYKSTFKVRECYLTEGSHLEQVSLCWPIVCLAYIESSGNLCYISCYSSSSFFFALFFYSVFTCPLIRALFFSHLCVGVYVYLFDFRIIMKVLYLLLLSSIVFHILQGLNKRKQFAISFEYHHLGLCREVQAKNILLSTLRFPFCLHRSVSLSFTLAAGQKSLKRSPHGLLRMLIAMPRHLISP